ncbi:MAG: hypothetical protein HXY18_10830 [Bryobacteraceae bacterium]|nr:hypothetical protein [Bryobacteraceae bacterium]
MTPVPIDLPLRPSEAASLAELVYEQAAGRKLSDDLRSRLAGHASTLGLKSIAPHFGSLEPYPIHPATYYIAVDGLTGAGPVPLLLHMAPASSPASGIFPKPLLIGRMRPAGGREIVMNAIPFGPHDTEAVAAYATQVSTSFLPRARGSLPLIWFDTGGDAISALEALHACRSFLRSTGLNIAGLRISSASKFWPMVWAAIRAGFREGYSLAGPFDKDSAKLLSCFRVRPGEALEAFHFLRSVRAGIPFDLELDLRQGEAAAFLDVLKSEGVTPQFVLSEQDALIHGALPAIEIAPRTVDEARCLRSRLPAACALTVFWDGREPPAAGLLEALR